LQQAKDVYFDRIIDIIRHVQIPDFSFDQGYVNGNTFTVVENSNNVKFSTDPLENALVFSVSDLSCWFKASEFQFDEMGMTAAGQALVVMKNVVVAVGLKMDTQNGSDERLLPAVSVLYVSIKINKGDLNIRLDGNRLTELVSWFDVLFTGTICN